MNEEQRLDASKVKQKTEEKDYSQYFQHVYQPPNLRDARRRGKTEVEYHKDFEIDERFKGLGKGRKFYIRTYGCQMNVHDTEVIAGIFTALGYEHTDTTDDADVILLNTCAIRENAENKVFSEIGNLKHVKQNNPEVLIGVSGCMDQEESVVNKILKSYQNVDIIFGTHNIHRLPNILDEAYMSKEKVIEVWSKEGDVIENLPKVREGGTKAWVNIMYGCDKFCTYCIVPFTRGKERSRMPEDILEEVRDLAARGYQEITLLGQNVNSYGKDLDLDYSYDLGDLMSDVSKTDIPRVRFTTSHPWDFTDNLIDVLATGENLMPHIHLPVQSGNDDVLKIMGRKYTREAYLGLVGKIRAKMPDVALTTDIIVGYPNETEEQFLDTMSLYQEVGFEHAYTYIYSPRDGTPAAKMEDNVSDQDKKDRLQRLNRLVTHYTRDALSKYQDAYVNVLCEGTSKKRDDIYAGYTDKSKLVNFTAPSDDVIGKIVKVKVTETRNFSLMGEFVEVLNEEKVEA